MAVTIHNHKLIHWHSKFSVSVTYESYEHSLQELPKKMKQSGGHPAGLGRGSWKQRRQGEMTSQDQGQEEPKVLAWKIITCFKSKGKV